mgnify:CR=1 FL=1
MELEIGSIYEGKVTGITKFGAFVLLPMGKSGMVHISEVANTFVDDINNYLKEGQTVTVKAELCQIPVFLNNRSADVAELLPIFEGAEWKKIKG